MILHIFISSTNNLIFTLHYIYVTLHRIGKGKVNLITKLQCYDDEIIVQNINESIK